MTWELRGPSCVSQVQCCVASWPALQSDLPLQTLGTFSQRSYYAPHFVSDTPLGCSTQVWFKQLQLSKKDCPARLQHSRAGAFGHRCVESAVTLTIGSRLLDFRQFCLHATGPVTPSCTNIELYLAATGFACRTPNLLNWTGCCRLELATQEAVALTQPITRYAAAMATQRQ